MHFWIKNCGLTTPEAITRATETGATHIGLMHYPASPRHLELEAGAALRAHISSSIVSVAVMVDPDDRLLEALISAWHPTILQLHGVHSPERLTDIHTRYGVDIILAQSVASADDIRKADAIASEVNIHSLLLDTAKKGMHGGTGETFDWELLNEHRPQTPWFLAGGLTPENVTAAIHATTPHGVDVSSGIESSPGKKSLEKIAAFNKAVLLTAHGNTQHT